MKGLKRSPRRVSERVASAIGGIVLAVMAPRSDASFDDRAPVEVKPAIERSLALIQKSAAEYPKQRDCFSCHHQAVPVYAMSLARTRGFSVTTETFQEQLDLTETDLAAAAESYRSGRGQGGGVTRAGYALWTLGLGNAKPNETTDAVVSFLLSADKARDHWRTSSNRPPTEASPFTATFLAIRALQTYARNEQKENVDRRVKQAREWLAKEAGKDTEDRVFRLRALKAAGAEEPLIRVAAEALAKTQHDDGGWAQLDDGSSDAYATGSTLVALHEAGGLATDDPVYRRGVAYLLRNQKEDGSWLVTSRSKPFQTYFESGFPHGKNQFVSIAATSWATAALLLTCPTAD